MKEERERDRIRVRRDELAVELEDDIAFCRSVERAYAELGEAILRQVDALTATDAKSGNSGAGSYRSLLTAVHRFSENVRGFTKLNPADRIQLLKNAFFQVLVLRFVWLRARSQCRDDHVLPLDASLLPRILQLSPKDPATETLISNIIDFVQRFRGNHLNEGQMALLTTVVLCQSGSGISSTQNPLQEEDLVNMLRAKLERALQFTWMPMIPIAVTLLVQSLTTALGDLARLNAAYLNLPSLSRVTRTSNGEPVTQCKSEPSVENGESKFFVTLIPSENSTNSSRLYSNNHQSRQFNGLCRRHL
ncbi:hypothetical protein AAVH_04626 [Aphelenchoides avenae]|nr:hypothetical protein AAVH_04626 [Aphelenchus avenae]